MVESEGALADRLSRRRARGTAIVALVFLALQWVARPVFRSDAWATTGFRPHAWALNALLLLIFLLPVGGVLFGARVRALVNDDVTRENLRVTTAAGFWLMMILALGAHVLGWWVPLSGRETTWAIVTPTVVACALLFAWREAKAFRGG